VPRALLSVYDKTGVVDFARALHDLGWELLSSGGTAKAIADAGIPVIDVATVTGYPAILGHRVVTLHPSIHGALLADTDNAEHVADMHTHNIEPITLAAINLYPFSSNPSIELIDIGGPAMVRAAAKNHAHVAVITEPTQYDSIIDAIRTSGRVPPALRQQLAAQAFATTAAYDAQVAQWFAAAASAVAAANDTISPKLPQRITLHLVREQNLRYGENPHQRGARYTVDGEHGWWSTIRQLGGKEMSYLNVLDSEAACKLAWSFDEPCAVVIKHANPCGLAIAHNIENAYRNAHACDPLSAFGGVVAINREATVEMARDLSEVFTEVLIAPSYEAGAIEILSAKKNLRILQSPAPIPQDRHVRQISGGFLVQDTDPVHIDTTLWQVVTTAQPTASQMSDCVIAWITCASVSSNAIVLVHEGSAVGIGGGQQNRIDAARLACERAGSRAHGSVCASDAFFPFRDGPELLISAGVKVIVQPGGSQRDDESIATANAHGIAMIFTGMRHFRH
jgi:phosphoribosylaminoimidazolecarboxamide formyltransferase / IMP cyclohydrolase